MRFSGERQGDPPCLSGTERPEPHTQRLVRGTARRNGLAAGGSICGDKVLRDPDLEEPGLAALHEICRSAGRPSGPAAGLTAADYRADYIGGYMLRH